MSLNSRATPRPIYRSGGTISGVEVILLAQHEREHTQAPAKVYYCANIHAIKKAESRIF